MEKDSNSRHRELKLLRFRRARTRKIKGWLKDKSLILRILKPDIERMMQELIYESPLRSCINQFQAPNAIDLQLHFKSELPRKLFTGTSIERIDVVIRRGNSKEVELTGHSSKIMVEMVVLNGDFEKEDWTEEEFEDNIVEAREGRGSLLIGKKLVIELKNGIGNFANIKITDNSSWTRSGFRLGVRVVQGNGLHERIREARSKAFSVRDIRGKSSEKHDYPLPVDEIWRLKNISNNGVYFKKLSGNGIKTVQDFLRLYITDPDSLPSIMPKKTLVETLMHAQKCTIDPKSYSYSSTEEEFTLLLDSIYRVVGVKFGGLQSFQKPDELSPSLKNKLEKLKQKAYKNKEKIEEYNEEKPQEVASTPETSTVNLPNPEAITQLNEIARPSLSHPTNVPPRSLRMIIPPLQQGNGGRFSAMDNNSSNMPTVRQQVHGEGFFQDLQPQLQGNGDRFSEMHINSSNVPTVSQQHDDGAGFSQDLQVLSPPFHGNFDQSDATHSNSSNVPTASQHHNDGAGFLQDLQLSPPFHGNSDQSTAMHINSSSVPTISQQHDDDADFSHYLQLSPPFHGNFDQSNAMHNNSSNVPTVSQQHIDGAGFLQDLQLSPPFHGNFDQSDAMHSNSSNLPTVSQQHDDGAGISQDFQVLSPPFHGNFDQSDAMHNNSSNVQLDDGVGFLQDLQLSPPFNGNFDQSNAMHINSSSVPTVSQQHDDGAGFLQNLQLSPPFHGNFGQSNAMHINSSSMPTVSQQHDDGADFLQYLQLSPQFHGNFDQSHAMHNNSSNMPTVSQQDVDGASFLQDLQLSPPFHRTSTKVMQCPVTVPACQLSTNNTTMVQVSHRIFKYYHHRFMGTSTKSMQCTITVPTCQLSTNRRSMVQVSYRIFNCHHRFMGTSTKARLLV